MELRLEIGVLQDLGPGDALLVRGLALAFVGPMSFVLYDSGRELWLSRWCKKQKKNRDKRRERTCGGSGIVERRTEIVDEGGRGRRRGGKGLDRKCSGRRCQPRRCPPLYRIAMVAVAVKK